MRAWISSFAVALAVTLPVAVARDAGPPDADAVPRIVVAGSVRLPDEAVAADGTRVQVTGVSGVTSLGVDGWVAALDTGTALVEFTLPLAADGAPREVRDVRAIPLAGRHDYEDVAVLPSGGADGPEARGARRLVLCEEDTPALRIVDVAGAEVGGLPLPAVFAARRPNRGPEALCAAIDGRALWTANEEALAVDGPAPTRGAGTLVRLVEVPLAAGSPPGRQIAYVVDPPHACVPADAADVHSGLVALAALPDGRLLVLERSAARCLPPFESRIYVVDPARATPVANVADGLDRRPVAAIPKRLAWRGGLGCNLEGLAIGPELPAGGRPLVAVADSGGLGTPTQLVVLRMDGPVTSP